MSTEPERVVVFGLGNAARSDDAAGLIAARRLHERAPALDVREHERDPVALLDGWQDAGTAIVIDAVDSGREPGTLHRLDASAAALPADLRSSSSTHALGLADAIELARGLGRLPRRVLVFGIEGEQFEAGTELSPPVAAAVDDVVDAVLRLAVAAAFAPPESSSRLR